MNWRPAVRKMLWTALVLLITISSVTAPAVGVVSFAGTSTMSQASSDNPSQLPDSQVFDGTSDGQIQVWERTAFPLRSDDTNAETQVTPPKDVIGATGFGEKDLIAAFGEQNPTGVHNVGSEITISYEDSRANSGDLSDQQRVDVIAARITGSGNGVPSTYSDLVDLLGDVENANENATFQVISNGGSLDGAGERSDTFTPSQPGQYIVFAGVHEQNRNGFEVDNGKISVDGEVVMIGADQIAVQENPANVEVIEAGATGSTVEFSVDSSDAVSGSPEMTHVVAVYDKNKFEDSRFELDVDNSQLGPDFDISTDSEFRHSLQNVNGVADVEDGITVNGIDLSDGQVQRTVSAGQTVDFIASDIGTTSPQTTAIQEGGADNNEFEDLNASVTAVSGADPQATIEVDTFRNFSSGEYQFVVYSMRDDDSSIISADTGTVSLDEPSAFGSGSISGRTGSVPLTSTTGGTPTVSSVDFTYTSDVSGNTGTRVTQTDSLPSSTGGESKLQEDVEDVSQVATSTQINAPDPASGEEVTVSVTISRSEIPTGSSPSDLTVARFNNGAFQELDTRVASSTSSDVTLEFDTPGFSIFAIAVTSSGSGGGGGGGGGNNLDISSQFLVSGLFPETVEVTQGNNIGISASVRADTAEQQTQDVELRVDGDTVATKTVTLGGGESTTVQFTDVSTSDLEPGEYEHGIFTADDSQTGTLTITAPDGATPTSTPETGTDEQTEADEPATEPDDDAEVTDDPATEEQETTAAGGPGFTVVVALIAIIAVALLTRRQKS